MNITRIDEYYSSADRPSIRSTSRDNWLQSVIIRDILVSYLRYGKGGYNARYGTVNSRGGSNTTAIAPRYRQEALTSGDDTRIQDSGRVARQAKRPGCVCRIAEVQIREKAQADSGKLISLSVAVARQSLEVSQATSESLVANRYFMLILPQKATLGNTKQHEHGDSVGRVLRTMKQYAPDPQELRHLYLDKRMSLREIAEHLQVCRETVRNALRRLEIPLRNDSQGQKVKWEKRMSLEPVECSDQERHCASCDQVKPLDAFRRYRNGYSWKCKACLSIIEIQDRKDHPEKHRERDKRARLSIKADPAKRAKQITYRRTHYSRHYRRKLYNLTQEAYQALLESQDYKCALCRKPETVKAHNGKPRALAVDHDHITGKVRGLLCFRCNTDLAILEDEAFVSSARAYISRCDGEELA